VLEFEERSFPLAGVKDETIVLELGMRPQRYFQILNHLIDDPRALAERPLLVKRLLRLRGERLQARQRRSFG